MNKRIKTPVMLQMEAAECGAASLGSVLGYYGKFLPLEKLRQLAGVSRNGSNAQNIVLAAESLGLKGSGYSYTPEEMKKVVPPAIIHWGFNHFLVYEGYDEKKDIVYLNDPGFGHRDVTWKDFEETFTGICLVLRPSDDFQPDGKKPGVWRQLLDSLFQSKAALAFVLTIGASLAVVNLFVPVISQVFFDDVITYRHRSWLFEVLLGLAVSLVLLATLSFLRSWVLLRWRNSLAIGESARYLDHVLHLPADFFQQRYAGEIASRVQLNDTVAEFVTGQLATTVLDAALAVFYLVLLWLYDWELTLVGLVFTALNICVTAWTFRWSSEQQLKIQQEAGRLYGLSVAGIASIETLKANGSENDFFVKWANYNTRYLTLMQETEYYGQFISFVPAVLAGINAALVMAVGGFRIMDGFMTVGVFVAFQRLMANFQSPVSSLVGISQQIQQTQSQMMKLGDVLNYPIEDVPEYSDDVAADIPARLTGSLEFQKVTFGYAAIGKPFLKKLNLHIEPGRRLALVGKSGSGKSTAAKLATGFYQPWSGQILYDGIPLEKIPRQVLANSISLVEQEIYLFEGTVAENIALFDSSISREDIIRAARDACIHEDISALNGGYDAAVEEGGANFSGGQRQRLEIARALATNPSLLIFDEATSALDPVVEAQIMTNIRRRGCSCLIIAHRLSTIRDCDEIVVLSKGRVIERGNHDELVAKGGTYSELVAQ